MATTSTMERVSHVLRRLSMGVQPETLATVRDVDGARAAALDLAGAPPTPLDVPAPASFRDAKDVTAIAEPIAWWVRQMASGHRMIEERLVWFWHDHFATSVAKVKVPFLMYRQHLTIRQHATGSFRELLHAMAKDPAMLVYLDGITNTAAQRNENFGRECMELFTLGRDGGYTQDDVVAASRSFSGWVVNAPGRRFSRSDVPAWSSYVAGARHDDRMKTLLGVTGTHDLDGALEILLDHPATARHVAGKLYRELVGLDPDDATTTRLADSFRRDYAILPLVESVVADPAFVSDAAVRAKVRTPVEKLVGLLQAVPGASLELGRVNPRARGGRANATGAGPALRALSYIPFVPPNVGGFPKGPRLLGPHQLVHSFDLLSAVGGPPPGGSDPGAAFTALGLFDVNERSRKVVASESDPARRFALVVGSPEYALT